jgi:uncharacterized protein with GYD domain
MRGERALGRQTFCIVKSGRLFRRAAFTTPGKLRASTDGGSHANVHTVAQLDRARNPRDQGRSQAGAGGARARQKVGVEIKEVYLTSGDDDLLVIVDTPNGDNVAKFALALGAQGCVRTRTARAWPQSEFQKLISELP